MVIRAMASSSNASGNTTPVQPTEKLIKINHTVWYAQVRAALRGAKLMGYLTGETKLPLTEISKIGDYSKEVKTGDERVLIIPNLDHEDWDAMDQQVLSYLLASLSKDILTHVASCATSAKAWAAIQDVFASQAHAWTVNTRLALGTTRKGNLSITKYFSKMKALGDEMVEAGRSLDDDKLIEYIIIGLDEEYTPFVSTICARTGFISLSECYSQLLTFETHTGLLQDGQNRSSNSATRGGFRG
jgi:hypothetical protein